MLITNLWTDGSGSARGPIGWAWVLQAVDTETGEVLGERRGDGAFREGTNNRAELMGAIAGLEALTRPAWVVLHTDSKYVGNPIERGWLARWASNGWVKSTDADDSPAAACPTCASTGKPGETCDRHDPPATLTADYDPRAVKNRDLWARLHAALQPHRVTVEHVKGHTGIPLNEDCDERAGAARKALKLHLETEGVHRTMANPPCRYPAHRTTDWHGPTPGNLIVCGLCHPPASPETAIRRGDPGFHETPLPQRDPAPVRRAA